MCEIEVFLSIGLSEVVKNLGVCWIPYNLSEVQEKGHVKLINDMIKNSTGLLQIWNWNMKLGYVQIVNQLLMCSKTSQNQQKLFVLQEMDSRFFFRRSCLLLLWHQSKFRKKSRTRFILHQDNVSQTTPNQLFI